MCLVVCIKNKRTRIALLGSSDKYTMRVFYTTVGRLGNKYCLLIYPQAVPASQFAQCVIMRWGSLNLSGVRLCACKLCLSGHIVSAIREGIRIVG